MAASLKEFHTKPSNNSSFLSYRQFCCCLCTKSGSNDLFDFDAYTSRLKDVRESATLSPLPLDYNHHNYHRLEHSDHASLSSHEEQQMLSSKVAISGGVIWLLQYALYSMLFSIYPLKYIETETTVTNLFGVAIIIILIPFTSLVIIPLLQTYQLIYILGRSRCIIIGLLCEGILCIAFQLIPNLLAHDTSLILYAFYAMIRILFAVFSAFIELSFISLMIQITPPKVLSGQQCMPLFCMIGLMGAPIVSAYFYCFGYDSPFVIIGIMIIISSFVVFLYLPTTNHMQFGTQQTSSSSSIYWSVFNDMNIIYSSIIAIYSLICITYLMFILSIYLNRIESNYFSAHNDLGVSHIAIYYLAFGLSFIIVSFPAGTITYRNCGSLRTMLCGMCGMAIGLLFVSNVAFIFPQHHHNSLVYIINGLVITGASAAFSMTPYLLYLRNAIYLKYREKSTQISFDIYRFVVCLGILIGPILACVSIAIDIDDDDDIYTIQLTLFILSIIAVCISLIGFLLSKCLQWEWIKSDPNHKNIQQPQEYEIKYIPILQDDKPFCCCCQRMMCFFSFGALCDPKYARYKKLRMEDERKRKQKKNRSKHARMRSRRSFDETPKQNVDNIVKIRKKSSQMYDIDRISVDGSNAESEYVAMLIGDDGKVEKKNNFMLSQSWNTILNNDKNNKRQVNLTPFAVNRDRSTSSETGSTSLTREKSRILTVDEAKAMSRSQRNMESTTTLTGTTSDTKTRKTILAPHIAISRRSSGSLTPLDPNTPIHPSISHDTQLQLQHSAFSYSAPRMLTLSQQESGVSSTEAPSHTFLLLTDEDFASKQGSAEDVDIYNDVPEMQQQSGTTFTVQ